MFYFEPFICACYSVLKIHIDFKSQKPGQNRLRDEQMQLCWMLQINNTQRRACGSLLRMIFIPAQLICVLKNGWVARKRKTGVQNENYGPFYCNLVKSLIYRYSSHLFFFFFLNIKPYLGKQCYVSIWQTAGTKRGTQLSGILTVKFTMT